MSIISQNIPVFDVTNKIGVPGNPQTKSPETSYIGPKNNRTADEAVVPGINVGEAKPNDALLSIRMMRSAINANQQPSENQANSLIRDASTADEVINLTKAQIIEQSGARALGQGSHSAENVLSLLR